MSTTKFNDVIELGDAEFLNSGPGSDLVFYDYMNDDDETGHYIGGSGQEGTTLELENLLELEADVVELSAEEAGDAFVIRFATREEFNDYLGEKNIDKDTLDAFILAYNGSSNKWADLNDIGINATVKDFENLAYVIVDDGPEAPAINGFLMSSNEANDYFGYSVSNAGDVNGDGIDDLIIGAFAVSKSYVVFGSATLGIDAPLDVGLLDGADGFVIEGTGVMGTSVSNAGDVNNDGIDDLIIGASNFIVDGVLGLAGATYLVLGSEELGASGVLDLDPLGAGENATLFLGFQDFGQLGSSVSNAGDVNDDGFDDLIMTAPGSAANSEVYVFFGADPWTLSGQTIDLGGVHPDDMLIIQSDTNETRLGASVSNTGDINGDGIDDLMVGAPYASGQAYYSGESYVIFGNGTLGGTLNVSDLDGSNGFVIQGPGYNSGRSVSVAGDINGDGVNDLIVGESGYNSNAAAYVVFGGQALNNTGGTLLVEDLDGTNGFKIDSAGDYGFSVSNAGDVNGDGIDDLIIGGYSPGARAYVLFGNEDFGSEDADATVDTSSLDGTNGFAIQSEHGIKSFSNAGDVNNDGIDDLIIGSSTEGESYVIYGRADGQWGPDGVVYLSLIGEDNFNPGPVALFDPETLIFAETSSVDDKVVRLDSLFDDLDDEEADLIFTLEDNASTELYSNLEIDETEPWLLVVPAGEIPSSSEVELIITASDGIDTTTAVFSFEFFEPL